MGRKRVGRARPFGLAEIELATIVRARAERQHSQFEIKAISGRYYYVHRRGGEAMRRIVYTGGITSDGWHL